MAYEYVGWLEFPAGIIFTCGFYEYMRKNVLEPLQKNGYTLTNHYLTSVWDFEKAGVELSLEYSDNGGDFSLIVDTLENGEWVFEEFLKFTTLVKWRPYID